MSAPPAIARPPASPGRGDARHWRAIVPAGGTGCQLPGRRGSGIRARAVDGARGADPGLRRADDHTAAHVDGLRVELTEGGDGEPLLRPADVPADDDHRVGLE